MTSKRLLKFYFCADGIEGALDRLILREACDPSHCADALHCAERVQSLVLAKVSLSALWAYIDGVMGQFGEGDRSLLFKYALSCSGFAGVEGATHNAVRRTVVRFMRRARRLGDYAGALALVDGYCAFL